MQNCNRYTSESIKDFYINWIIQDFDLQVGDDDDDENVKFY